MKKFFLKLSARIFVSNVMGGSEVKGVISPQADPLTPDLHLI